MTLRNVLSLAVSMLALCTQDAGAAIVAFNASAFAPGDPLDDAAAEAAYLAAVADGGYTPLIEDFTDSVWDVARSSITQGTHSVVSVTNQGIDWHSSEGDFITTTSTGGNNQAPWQIYSKETAVGGLHAVPATIIGDSTRTLYGIGMWVSGTYGGKLNLIFDGDTANPVSFQQITGYENGDPQEPIKETVLLGSAKQFFGAIVPEGFNTFQLLETEGVPEDQKLMWAADFTLAASLLTWDGTTNEWGTSHWNDGSGLVGPTDGRDMVVDAGWVDVDGTYHPLSLHTSGGTTDISSTGTLNVSGQAVADQNATLNVDGTLTATDLLVLGGDPQNGIPGGTITGSGVIVANTFVLGGTLSPGSVGGPTIAQQSTAGLSGPEQPHQVPEPSTFVLLMLGVLGFLAYRRRGIGCRR